MKITLCGSTRFADLFREANEKLSLAGHIVYSLGVFPPKEDVTAEQKEVLDLVHLRKIAESDAVVWVTDESNYIGDSTRRELIWAHMLGKDIAHYRQVDGSLTRSKPGIPIASYLSELVHN